MTASLLFTGGIKAEAEETSEEDIILTESTQTPTDAEVTEAEISTEAEEELEELSENVQGISYSVYSTEINQAVKFNKIMVDAGDWVKVKVPVNCDLTLYLKGGYSGKSSCNNLNLFYWIYKDSVKDENLVYAKDGKSDAIETGKSPDDSTYKNVLGGNYDYKETINLEAGTYILVVRRNIYGSIDANTQYYYNALFYYSTGKEFVSMVSIDGLEEPIHHGTPIQGNEPTVRGDELEVDTSSYSIKRNSASANYGINMNQGYTYTFSMKLKVKDSSKYEFGNSVTGYLSGLNYYGSVSTRRFFLNGEEVSYDSDDFKAEVSADGSYMTITIVYDDFVKIHDGITFDKQFRDDESVLNKYNKTEPGYYVLPEGNYCLTRDITIDKPIKIAASSTVNFCLAGHKINYSGIMSEMIEVAEGSTLNLYDCGKKYTGTIDGTKLASGTATRPMLVSVYGTFNMYGGRLTNAYRGSEGSAVTVFDSGTFNLYDGSIDHNTSGLYGAVTTMGADSRFNMYGGTIENNTSNGKGAAIHQVHDASAIYIYGGTIKDNVCNGDYGGAIYANVLFLYGGTITGNSVTKASSAGGGIYIRGGKVYISGKPVVKDNLGYDGIADNLYLGCNSKGDVAQISFQELNLDMCAEVHVKTDKYNTRLSINCSKDCRTVLRSDVDGYVFVSETYGKYYYVALEKVILTEQIVIDTTDFEAIAGEKYQIKYHRVPEDANDEIEVVITYCKKIYHNGYFSDYLKIDTDGNVYTKVGINPASDWYYVSFKTENVSVDTHLLVTDATKYTKKNKLLFNKETGAVCMDNDRHIYLLYVPEGGQKVEFDYTCDQENSTISIAGLNNDIAVSMEVTEKDGKYVANTSRLLPEGYYYIILNNNTSDEMEYTLTAKHTFIKGKCQMPYYGEGGGFLIGIESNNNPNNSYTYEILILDCTLLAEGKDAWVSTTTRCGVAPGEKCLWWLWQPKYGYYWTLFRVFDKDGNLLEEQCYGFQNI